MRRGRERERWPHREWWVNYNSNSPPVLFCQLLVVDGHCQSTGALPEDMSSADNDAQRQSHHSCDPFCVCELLFVRWNWTSGLERGSGGLWRGCLGGGVVGLTNQRGHKMVVVCVCVCVAQLTWWRGGSTNTPGSGTRPRALRTGLCVCNNT